MNKQKGENRATNHSRDSAIEGKKNDHGVKLRKLIAGLFQPMTGYDGW